MGTSVHAESTGVARCFYASQQARKTDGILSLGGQSRDDPVEHVGVDIVQDDGEDVDSPALVPFPTLGPVEALDGVFHVFYLVILLAVRYREVTQTHLHSDEPDPHGNVQEYHGDIYPSGFGLEPPASRIEYVSKYDVGHD